MSFKTNLSSPPQNRFPLFPPSPNEEIKAALEKRSAKDLVTVLSNIRLPRYVLFQDLFAKVVEFARAEQNEALAYEVQSYYNWVNRDPCISDAAKKWHAEAMSTFHR